MRAHPTHVSRHPFPPSRATHGRRAARQSRHLLAAALGLVAFAGCAAPTGQFSSRDAVPETIPMAPAAPVVAPVVAPVTETTVVDAIVTPQPSLPDDAADELADEADVYEGEPGVESGVAVPGSMGEPTPGADAASPVDLDPVTPTGDPAPDDDEINPCRVAEDHGQQFWAQERIELAPGVMTGSVPVTVCSAEHVGLSIASVPSVTLSAEAIDAPAEGAVIDFSINEDAWDTGAIEFRIKFTEDGCCAQYVTVVGFRPGFRAGLVADVGLSAGAGAGGCNNSCITKAWMTPNLHDTNIALEIRTDTPAKIEVFVSDHAPVADAHGDPSFPGVPAVATSPDGVQTFDAALTGLAAATNYHLVVRATDALGHTTVAATPFRTVTPYEAPDQLAGEDPGCSVQCILHATATPTAFDRVRLSATLDTLARLDVYVGTGAVVGSGAAASLPGAAAHRSSPDAVDAWDTTIEGLAGDTSYTVLLVATDDHGRVSSASGTFRTPAEPTVAVRATFERIDVVYDGDRQAWNKGELRFGWFAGGDLIGERSEQKLDDGASVRLRSYHTVWFDLRAGETTDRLEMWGGERDGSWAGFCEAPKPELDCGAIWWSGASLPPMTLAEISALPSCSEYGLDDVPATDRCTHMSVTSAMVESKREPRFNAVVSFHVEG